MKQSILVLTNFLIANFIIDIIVLKKELTGYRLKTSNKQSTSSRVNREYLNMNELKIKGKVKPMRNGQLINN